MPCCRTSASSRIPACRRRRKEKKFAAVASSTESNPKIFATAGLHVTICPSVRMTSVPVKSSMKKRRYCSPLSCETSFGAGDPAIFLGTLERRDAGESISEAEESRSAGGGCGGRTRLIPSAHFVETASQENVIKGEHRAQYHH